MSGFEFDPVDYLLSRELQHIVINIFSHLDFASLRRCLWINSSWRQFLRQDYVLKKLDFERKETEYHGHKKMTLVEVCPPELPPNSPEWMPEFWDLKLDKMPILCKGYKYNEVWLWLYNEDFIAFRRTTQSDVVFGCRRRCGDEFDGKMSEIRVPLKLKECRKVVTSHDVAVAVDEYGWNEGLKLGIFRLAGDTSEIVQVTRPDGEPLELIEEEGLLDPYESFDYFLEGQSLRVNTYLLVIGGYRFQHLGGG